MAWFKNRILLIVCCRTTRKDLKLNQIVFNSQHWVNSTISFVSSGGLTQPHEPIAMQTQLCSSGFPVLGKLSFNCGCALSLKYKEQRFHCDSCVYSFVCACKHRMENNKTQGDIV